MIQFRHLRHSAVVVAICASLSGWSVADDKAPARGDQTSPNAAAGPNTAEKAVAFLGIAVEPIHPAVASHLKTSDTSEQGLSVQMVSAQSPADQAGVKVHDIVLAYDDQKLFTPEQLVKLVAGDRPGREVKLSLIHEGSPETLMVKLGERTVGSTASHSEATATHSARSKRPRMIRREVHPAPHILNWEDFDSITIKRLEKNRFQVSVTNTDNGKTQKHEYQGTRDEVRAQIDADKDLRPQERAHLLHGLGMHAPHHSILDDDQVEF